MLSTRYVIKIVCPTGLKEREQSFWAHEGKGFIEEMDP